MVFSRHSIILIGFILALFLSVKPLFSMDKRNESEERIRELQTVVDSMISSYSKLPDIQKRFESFDYAIELVEKEFCYNKISDVIKNEIRTKLRQERSNCEIQLYDHNYPIEKIVFAINGRESDDEKVIDLLKQQLAAEQRRDCSFITQCLSDDNDELLHFAINAGRAKVVDFLLENGASFSNKKVSTGNTVLHEAARWARPAIVRLLIEKCSPKSRAIFVNYKNNDRQTALHLAARGHCLNTLSMLLKYEPNLASKDSQGKSPLDLAYIKLHTLSSKIRAFGKKNGVESFDLLQSHASTLCSIELLEKAADTQKYEDIVSSIAPLFE